MRTRAVPALAAALTALLLAPAAPAAAHNALQSAAPAQDARLTAAPTSVTLRFLQRLNPEFTTIVLSDAERRKVPTGVPAVDGTAGTVTVDQPLANGTYTVAYRVVSADGHPVQGSYRFTVADPAAPAAAGVAGTSTPATPVSAAGAHDGPPLALVAGGVVVALAAAGAAVLLLRRRRTS
ncbi:copper resistance CopC family protein [Micromonospora sp. WMMD980]|uniref:copper resistance CopC family protein n=1 Tax=Micromonospora sp. WMMD980 TaxID=3016088 RepID=UPI0024174BEC|nr:copper resistance CopC family protein [Micromonospora sp. WMMD980]MDG4800377.1 copper resistance protein CopC [Micromonospora sp. WMMD980]